MLQQLAAKRLKQIQAATPSAVAGPDISDFEAFCGLIDIVPKSGGRCKLKWNKLQRLYNASRTARDIMLKARQGGATTNEQARDIWHMLTVPGARVVVTCQSSTDHKPAKLLSNTYRIMFESLQREGVPINFRTEATYEWSLADRDASLHIIEAGASQAAAQKKGRAGTITRLHLTETAFYEYAEETLNALLECVPGEEHGSEIVSESTPNGAQGVFYRQCKAAEAGESSYRLHFFPWFLDDGYAAALEPGEVIEPRDEFEETLIRLGCRPEQLKWYRQKVVDKGPHKTTQEYPSDPETCFLVSGRKFFDDTATAKLIRAAETAKAEPIEQRERYRIRIWAKPKPNKQYILAVDTSEGGGLDPSGALMYERATGEHVATIDGQFQPWELAEKAAPLGREYNTALIVVERNNHGHAVLQALEREQRYPNVYYAEDEKPGWTTNPVTRPQMLDALEDAHRKGLWQSKDRQVLSQFRTFVVTASGKPEAAHGEFDDLVLAAAIGWAVRQKPGGAKYDPSYNSYLPLPRI